MRLTLGNARSYTSRIHQADPSARLRRHHDASGDDRHVVLYKLGCTPPDEEVKVAKSGEAEVEDHTVEKRQFHNRKG